MDFLANYGLFFAKIITSVIAIIVVVAAVTAIASKGKGKEKLKIKKLNDKFKHMHDALADAVLSKKERKALAKQEKPQKSKKSKKHSAEKHRKRIFVVNFHGDIRAAAVSSFREEITAILSFATPKDEVAIRLESGGGMVHSYGLAASQIKRLKEHKIPVTVMIDKVAASGGYMMACVADKIIAAPFAIIGSVGVIAQVPNFNRWLKKKNIDFEQIMAGEYKRTLTVFGENTLKGREKFQADIDDTHILFKDFVKTNRDIVDIEQIATGEHWYGSTALELKLVDNIQTSDEFLLDASRHSDLYELSYSIKKSLPQRLAAGAQTCLDKLTTMGSSHA